MKSEKLFIKFFLLLTVLFGSYLPSAKAVTAGLSVSASTICTGSTVTLTVSTTPSGSYSYDYQYDNGLGGGYVTITTTSASFYAYAPLYDGFFRVNVYDAGHTTMLAQTNIEHVALTAGISPFSIGTDDPLSICYGNGMPFYITTSLTGVTYQWVVDGVSVPGATLDYYFTDPSLAVGTHTVSLDVNNGTCTIASTNTITITIMALPNTTITSSAGTNVCAYAPVTLTGPSGTGYGYYWAATNQYTQSTVVTPDGPGSITYSLLVMQAGACQATGYITLNTYPAPDVTVTPACGTTMCAGSSVTLNATVTPGFTYQWSDNGGNIAGATSPTLNYTSPITGMENVTVTATEPVHGCTNPVATTITTHACTGCTPANVFPSCQQYTVLSGTLLGFAASGGYYFVSDPSGVVNFVNVNITNAVILVDAGTTIHVENFMGKFSNVILDYDHILGCASMWNGITMDANTSLQLTNSFVEDAVTAISTSENVTSMQAYDNIFNRCGGGIGLAGSVSPHNPYPAFITNNIFTSRDFSSLPLTTLPQISDLLSPRSTTPNTYVPPYAMSDNTSPFYYPYIACKNGNPAVYGISVDGNTHPIYITNNDPNQTPNVFDNMLYGIMATNANMIVSGCVFMNMQYNATYIPTFEGGDGIYAEDLPGTQTAVRVGLNTDMFQNMFYLPDGNNTAGAVYDGVEVKNMYTFTSERVNMVSSQDISNYSPGIGNYGFDISSYNYDSVLIDGGTFYNIYYPISGVDDYHSSAQTVGSFNITNNQFAATNSGPYNPTSGGYMSDAISLENNGAGSASTVNGEIYIAYNNISDAFRGIYTNNFRNHRVIERDNGYIGMQQDPSSTTANQWGILNEDNLDDTIKNNGIYGPDYPSYALTSNTNAAGIWEFSCTSGVIQCNSVDDVYNSFDFERCAPTYEWFGNSMQNYAQGLYLNATKLGAQGGIGSPSGNQWMGSVVSGAWDTYVSGVSPAASVLYLQAGAPNGPATNGGSTPYTSGTTLISTGGAPLGCPAARPASVPVVNNIKQSYILSPNPGNGDMTLQQGIADNNAVNVQVVSTDGRLVYKGQLQFANRMGMVHLKGIDPGLYMIQLLDSKGNGYNMKYVVIK